MSIHQSDPTGPVPQAPPSEGSAINVALVGGIGTSGEAVGPARRRSSARTLQAARRPKALVSAVVIAGVVVTALLAPLLAPYDPNQQNLLSVLQPPAFAGGSLHHVLGTDALGRDVLSRIIFGSRVSLTVGLVAVVVSGVIGVLVGAVAGYVGGVLDAAIMRIVDLQLSLPFLVLAIAVIAALGASLQNVIIVLVISGWVSYARVVRAEVLSIREREFVDAARALGASDIAVIRRHVLPLLVSAVLVIGTLQVGYMILTESSLSFLGLGVPLTTPTWGGIAADGQDYLTTAWWITSASGFAIFLTVMAVNYLGDALRDVLDPTLKI
jgi:peptide/nickel transport system permease protein